MTTQAAEVSAALGTTQHTQQTADTDSFDYWWQRRGQWVEEANQRRGGESGVQILPPLAKDKPFLYCKRQSGHLYRSLRHPLGRPTVWREISAYQAFARLGINTPKLVYGGIRKQDGQWQALLVSEALQGFVSLDEWYATSPIKAQREAVLSATATLLARMHRAGWRHGCCYDKHLFVSTAEGKVQVVLLDLEKARRPLIRSHCRKDLEQLSRHRAGMPDEDMQFLQEQYRTLCKCSA